MKNYQCGNNQYKKGIIAIGDNQFIQKQGKSQRLD